MSTGLSKGLQLLKKFTFYVLL